MTLSTCGPDTRAPNEPSAKFHYHRKCFNVKALVDWHFLPGEGRDYENFAKGSLRALPDTAGTSHGSNAA